MGKGEVLIYGVHEKDSRPGPRERRNDVFIIAKTSRVKALIYVRSFLS